MVTLIRNGTVVSSTGAMPADVLVDGETIAAVIDPGATRRAST
jgi:dihydropyrimidinase